MVKVGTVNHYGRHYKGHMILLHSFIAIYTLPFWLHLAVTLHQLNQKVTGPLTLWMFLQEYRGLSRLGRTMANLVGLAASLRHYDKIRTTLLAEASDQIAEITSKGRCLIAFDNYNPPVWQSCPYP